MAPLPDASIGGSVGMPKACGPRNFPTARAIGSAREASSQGGTPARAAPCDGIQSVASRLPRGLYRSLHSATSATELPRHRRRHEARAVEVDRL